MARNLYLVIRPMLVPRRRAERTRRPNLWEAIAFATRADLQADRATRRPRSHWRGVPERPAVGTPGRYRTVRFLTPTREPLPYNGSANVYVVGPLFCASDHA